MCSRHLLLPQLFDLNLFIHLHTEKQMPHLSRFLHLHSYHGTELSDGWLVKF
jgi:hypothetical protein